MNVNSGGFSNCGRANTFRLLVISHSSCKQLQTILKRVPFRAAGLKAVFFENSLGCAILDLVVNSHGFFRVATKVAGVSARQRIS